MTQINFSSSNPDFQRLITEARAAASDGRITHAELNNLRNTANLNGLTADEQNFLAGLDSANNSGSNIENNIRTLRSKNFSPSNFSFNIRYSGASGDVIPDIHVEDSGNNPLNSQITDRGAEVDNAMQHSNRTIINQIRAAFPNNQIPPTFQRLVDTFRDNREALVYVKELAENRRFSQSEKEALANKILTMSSSSYDSRAGDPRRLAISALHDIAIPSDISQGSIGSCGGTCSQVQLAIRNPVRYLEMLDTLAKNQSFHANGATFQPNWTFSGDGTGRSISSSIMQNSIMDFANGSASYDSHNHNTPGISSNDVSRTNNALVGLNTSVYTGIEMGVVDTNSPARKQYLIQDLINHSPSPSNPIQVRINFSPQGQQDAEHFVNVVGINSNSVTFVNPWGRIENVSLQEFQSRIQTTIR